jgi:hypothetical protein
VRTAHDETLHFRVPAALRAELDGQARAAGVKLSVVTRNALAVGLASIRSTDQPDPPPPAGRAVALRAAA